MLLSVMQTEQIVALLIAERDRLSSAIAALEGSARPAGRPAKLASKPKRRLSAAGRKAIVAAARKRWAAIRAGKAPSPFAKAAGQG